MIIKNSRLRQYLSKNRYKILFGVIGIILLLLILGNLSDIAEEESKNKQNTTTNKIANTSNVYKPQETVISGGNISNKTQEENSNIINNFVNYCNNGQYTNAYNLLTNECKTLMYPTVEDFTQNYVKSRFTKKRAADIQSWYNDTVDTYKVKFVEDILSTGNANSTGTIEDYITIVTQNGESKLNVNGYICRKTMGATSTNNGITISLVSKDMYMDYEVYNIQITNNTENSILLDSKQNTDTVYLKNGSGNKFRASIYELSEIDLTVGKGQTKSLSIKFNKIYNPAVKMIAMEFENIIMNYEEYVNLQDKTNYKNINNIEIEL